MKKPLLSQTSSRKRSQFGCRLAIMVMAVGMTALLYTCLRTQVLQGTLTGYHSRRRDDSSSQEFVAGRHCDGIQSPIQSSSRRPAARMSILVGVFSTALRVERRSLLRVAYGIQPTEASAVQVTLRFVVGIPRGEEEELAVGLEALRYGDMLVVDCEENMSGDKTLTYFATVAAIAVRHDYVMKVDDDSYVRVDPLVRSLDPLPRTDLYYGFGIPCDKDDLYAGYMAGMGYVLSWDLVVWLRDSPFARNNTDGTEDVLMGEWLNAGGKAKHRVGTKPQFYEHPEHGGPCAHELIPDTILVHQLKYEGRWRNVLTFFERSRIGAVIAPAVARTPS